MGGVQSGTVRLCPLGVNLSGRVDARRWVAAQNDDRDVTLPRVSIMSNEKILIVEDDADMRLGYQVLLNAHHYQTFFAADAVAALTEADKHQPDLIILDLGLPAFDGFDVLDHYGPMFLYMVPVLVVSARDPDGNKERALKAGAKGYLQKPWNDDELLATISQLVEQPDLSGSRTP